MTLRNYLLILAIDTLAAAAVAATWGQQFTPPQASKVEIAPASCKNGACEAVVTYTAPSKAKDGQPVTWQESVSIKLDLTKTLGEACVKDDGPRPHAFVQTLKACPAP